MNEEISLTNPGVYTEDVVKSPAHNLDSMDTSIQAVIEDDFIEEISAFSDKLARSTGIFTANNLRLSAVRNGG